MDSPNIPEQKVIQVAPPPTRSGTKSLIFALTAFALISGVLAFSLGFIIGKVNVAGTSTQPPKESTPSALIAGWLVYLDKEALFSISHPKNWKTKKHDQSDYEGVRIEGSKGYVDLWLLVDQPFLLGEKHQKVINSEEELSVNVEGRTAPGTQYNYKAGNFFIVLVLPDTETSPQITFWVEVDDDKTRQEALKIVESFKFLN